MHSAPAPESCPTCLKPNHLCICEAVQPIDNGVFLLILQHPQEKRENLGTAQIAHLQFANSMVKVGLSWPGLKRILGREVDPKRWGVLYLGPVKEGGAPRAEVAVVDWQAGARGVGAAPAWTGPVSVAALVAAMYVFTIVAFQLIQSLPIIAIGGGHGH